MRRTATAALLSAALTFAGLALSAHVLSLILFDTGRPARVLEAMIETPEGKSLAADAIAEQLHRFAPQVSPAQADAIGTKVADDPRLPAALAAAGTKQGPAQRAAITEALVSSVESANPKVGKLIRAKVTPPKQASPKTGGKAGPAAVTGSFVPAAVDTAVSQTRETLETGADIGAGIALLLAAAAFVAGPRRDRMLVRVGRWALIVAGVQVLLWWVLPTYVLPRVDGRWPVVAAAGLSAAGGDLLRVFLLLAGAGVLALLAGYSGSFLAPVGHHREVPSAVRRAAARRAHQRSAGSGPGREPGRVTGDPGLQGPRHGWHLGRRTHQPWAETSWDDTAWGDHDHGGTDGSAATGDHADSSARTSTPTHPAGGPAGGSTVPGRR